MKKRKKEDKNDDDKEKKKKKNSKNKMQVSRGGVPRAPKPVWELLLVCQL